MMKYMKHVVAAHFARTNMGMPPVDVERLKSAFELANNVEDAVYMLCEEYMETGENESAFIEEAEQWEKEQRLDTLEGVLAVWPQYKELFEGALQ